MKLRIGLIAAVCLAFASLTAGCAGFDSFLDTPGAGGPPPRLSESPDPAVQAAGASSDAVDKVGAAEAEYNKALETKDLTHLDKAIALRPYDPSYYYLRAVLQDAEGIREPGRSKWEDINKGLGLHFERYGRLYGNDSEEARRQAKTSHALSTIDAFAVAKTHYPPGSEKWKHVNRGYCNWLRDLNETPEEVLASTFYSKADCPPAKP